MTKEDIRHVPAGSSWFTITASVQEYHVDFVGYKITGRSAQFDEPLYDGKDCDTTSDPEKAEVAFSGSVKWDGCSNWTVGDGEVMVHACGRNILDDVASAMSLCWYWSSELLKQPIVKK